MRIEVTRTGGFAGISRRASVETSAHPDGPRLEALAREATSADSPPRPAHGVPDGFTYDITAADRTIRCRDPHLSPAQRDLVQAVLAECA